MIDNYLQSINNYLQSVENVYRDLSEYPVLAGVAAAASYFTAKNVQSLCYLIPGTLAWPTAALIGATAPLFFYVNCDAFSDEPFSAKSLIPAISAKSLIPAMLLQIPFCWAMPVPVITTIFLTVVGGGACLLVDRLFGDRSVELSKIEFQDISIASKIKDTAQKTFKAAFAGPFLEIHLIATKALAVPCQSFFKSSTLSRIIPYIPNALGWANATVFCAIGTAIFFGGCAVEESLSPDYKWVGVLVTVLTYGTYCYFSPIPIIANIALTALGSASSSSTVIGFYLEAYMYIEQLILLDRYN